jgi:hypothetical protein
MAIENTNTPQTLVLLPHQNTSSATLSVTEAKRILLEANRIVESRTDITDKIGKTMRDGVLLKVKSTIALLDAHINSGGSQWDLAINVKGFIDARDTYLKELAKLKAALGQKTPTDALSVNQLPDSNTTMKTAGLMVIGTLALWLVMR